MKDPDVQEMMERGTSSNNAQVAFAPPTQTNQLKVRWAKIKRRIGNGSAPDDSLGEPTNTTDATSDNGSSFNNGRRWGRKNGGGGGGSKNGGDGKDVENEKETIDEVDEVVVEATGSPGSWKAGAGHTTGSNREGGASGGTNGGTGLPGTAMQSEGSSLRATAYDNASGVLGIASNFCRYRCWPLISNYLAPRYHDAAVEEAYQKELWYTHKSLCIFGACFLVFSWLMSIALLPRPWSLWNEVYNYGVGPLLSIPLIVGAALDFPRKKKWLWQGMVFCCVFMGAIPNIIDMYMCNYYNPNPALRRCGNRDFLGTLYAPTAGPVIALFALNQRRIFTLLYLVCWIGLIGGLILPSRVKFIRNVINVFIFQIFVTYVHYNLEMGSRRMYTLRAELKVQFRAKQKAQINERKTMDSKRRFSSYIFHEVRVPLNTALLAVQNISADPSFDKHSETAVEYAALEGSLSTMSTVLNDVLDFNRMERGGFSVVSRPFSLHQVMASIIGALRIDTNARGLLLETSLDRRIDEVAKKAAYPESDDSVVQEGDGVMLGDEMRLRQVINNLASNAAKFTSAGGKISIRTTLIHPLDVCARYDPSSTEMTHSDTTSATATHTPRLSQGRLQQHEAKTSPERKNNVMVARIEIQDTGVGIRSRDMAENRLFSAYAQTSVGLMQGGKGTGLGLSLVRQIVMLSGGRLGVKSKVGEGSTFWVEMPFEIGLEARMSDGGDRHRRRSSTTDKDLCTPSTSSERSDYRFMPSLPKRSSDPTLDSIGEMATADAPPAHYRFASPPTTPALQTSATFISLDSPAATPPLSVTPRLGQSQQQQQQQNEGADLLRRPSVPPKNLSSSSAPPALPPPAPKPKPPGLEFEDGPLRVLVVDDDALTRRLMGRMMQRLGCIVSTAENGAIALDMLLAGSGPSGSSESGIGVDPRSGNATKNYDITFLDNQMPVCSGVQVANRIRSLGRDDLLVGVTANALISDQQDYIDQGASAVLTKPVLEVDLRKYLIQADRHRAEARKPKLSRPPSPSAAVFPPPVLIRTRDDEF